MGSSISAIYDSYSTYKSVCQHVGVKPIDIRGQYYFGDHQDEILKLNGVDNEYNLFILKNPIGIEWIDIERARKRDKSIDVILE